LSHRNGLRKKNTKKHTNSEFSLFYSLRFAVLIGLQIDYTTEEKYSHPKFGSFCEIFHFEIAVKRNIGEIPFHSIEIKKNCSPEAIFFFYEILTVSSIYEFYPIQSLAKKWEMIVCIHNLSSP